jgi:hypothetical protein
MTNSNAVFSKSIEGIQYASFIMQQAVNISNKIELVTRAHYMSAALTNFSFISILNPSNCK